MARRRLGLQALATGAAIAALGVTGCDALVETGTYQQEFNLAQCQLLPTGRNDYFILEPGFQITLQDDEGKLQITVLDETKVVDGATTRVVEEREWIDGKLAEVARNFFAICQQTKDVFYFGEDVDFYENGQVVGHAGTWLAGKDGARPGLMMPGNPRVGMKYYQEVAPGVAMDRAEVVSLDEICKTPAGTFAKCLKTRERASFDFWAAVKFWEVEYKMYAPGIGLVQDQDLLLTNRGMASKQ